MQFCGDLPLSIHLADTHCAPQQYKDIESIETAETITTSLPIVVSVHHSALISSSRRAATTLLLSATLNYPQLIIAIVKSITTPQPIIDSDHLSASWDENSNITF